MRTHFFAALLVPLALFAGDVTVPTPLRGKALTLTRLESNIKVTQAAVIFLPGDGGWRGAAVSMGRAISSWGYDVYGFDTKKYLESFTEGDARLSREEVAADMRSLARQVAGASKRHVILVGWSQGAGMAVAAASGVQPAGPIQGVLTLGLPESAVLGWDWKATLAIIARREPDQPAFTVKPLLPAVAPTPIWMIHGSEDEYTTPQTARGLFHLASEPKQMEEIPGANHRFDGHQEELYRSLKKGLAWVGSR